MKLIDTTNPQASAGARTLLGSAEDDQALKLVRGLYFHVLGMYACTVGPTWDSGGLPEGDYRHYINIPFSGWLQVVHGRKVYDLKPGQAYFTPGNTPLVRRYRQPTRLLYIKFRCEWLPGMDPLLDWPGRAPVALGPVDVTAWRHWLQPGWKANVNHLLQLQGQIECWMATALPDLQTLVGRHLKTHTRFEKVYARIEEHLGADLRIKDLAAVYGTGIHTFSTTFSDVTGTSPKEYLNRRLNQEAVQLLLNTDLKVKEIAEKLRFTNEYYFNRFFQKHNGAPPARYRQRFRSGG